MEKNVKTSDLLFDLLAESVKPLIKTAINYFLEGQRISDEDDLAAIETLQVALKNLENIEDQFRSTKTNPPGGATDEIVEFHYPEGGRIKQDTGHRIENIGKQ